jgi:hypothetical protein
MSAARSGLYTALSNATVTALAAVVGVVIAREFGRGAETDGFFAAYGLFVVLVLAAVAFRLVVLPELARARDAGRLGAEAAAYALALAFLAAPLLAASLLAADPLADALTGDLPDEAARTTADVLGWMIFAAVAHLYAGLAASVLAALDDYVTAAAGYALGSVAGLALILVLVWEQGIVALAWGTALNGAVALAVPAIMLVRSAGFRTRFGRLALRARLGTFVRGVSLPLALQALYVVSLRFASEEGVGAVSSFSYAYLIASALIAVTASSIALVSSVPLTRTGLEGERAVRHVVATSWLALVLVAAGAGVFALTGEAFVSAALGSAYAGDVGSELGRLVAYLAPWMAASIGVSVTFPLLFVADRSRRLPLVAVLALAAHVPVTFAGERIAGLAGIAIALALTTAAILITLLALLSRGVLARAGLGIATATAVTGVVAIASYAVGAAISGPYGAAAIGLSAYGAAILLLRPRGLRDAWAYLHALR